ncbi:MAG: hypothetical protein DI534_16105 [Leifsonia xyli]|nr:MAG: hypothetical protein DI534_16105 [Leifsonia xyli]
MNTINTACAAGALLLASLTAAIAAPAATTAAVNGTNGAWVYDGRQPPSCNIRDIRVRHFEGDGHSSDAAEHAHLGHGHKWSKRNFKGYPTKPPCYVRRADGAQSLNADPSTRTDGARIAPTANALVLKSGDLS